MPTITLVAFIMSVNPTLGMQDAKTYADAIYRYSNAFQMSPQLVASIIATESSFRASAIGKAGEVGLMQLHPKYHGPAKYLSDFHTNLHTGIKYLAALKGVYGYQYPDMKWVEFYNRGPNCKRPKKFPYAKKVLANYSKFGGHFGKTVTANVEVRSSDRRPSAFAGKAYF